MRIGKALLLLALAGGACAPTPPVQPAAPAGAPPAARSTKTLTIGTLTPISGFAPWDIGTTQGGAAALAEIHSSALVTPGLDGKLEGRLAAHIPSLDDGTMAVLPSGRLQTTWKLRPNVRWHDGAPFTADDLAFSLRLYQDPDLPKGSWDAHTSLIERIDAPDPLTAVITWRGTFSGALHLAQRQFWPYPRHVLGDALAADRQAFPNLPYFTSEYVNLGPFRLADFGSGEAQIFESFDSFYLGEPRVDRIVVRAILDPNALFANIQAGAVDIVMEQTLPPDLFLRLRDEWRQTGGGTVVQRQGIWRYIQLQLRPEFARQPEVTRDVHARRGLLYAVDRDALRDTILPGVPDTSADTFMVKTDPRAAAVGQPFAAYRYDPPRAIQEFAEVGWRRGSGGRLLNAAGEQVEFPLRTSVQYPREAAIIADYWRQVGMDVPEEVAPAHLLRDSEYKAKFAGADVTGRGFNQHILSYFDSRLRAGPENRWGGANVPGYANPAVDRLIDALNATLDERDQGRALRDIGETLASDLPVLPTYFALWQAAVSKGVRALVDDYSSNIEPAGHVSRNAHLWDRD